MLIGRCADYILKGRPDVVRVFVHADADFCLEQAMLVDSLPEEEVVRKIAEIDDYRAKYYKHHTGRTGMTRATTTCRSTVASRI